MLCPNRGKLFLQRCKHKRIGKIHARAINAVAENVSRQRDRRIALGIQRRKFGHRIAGHLFDRNVRIGHAVDEAGVRAVLQKPADQICEQFLVPAYGRVNPNIGAIIAFRLRERVIDFLTHAMQALKFESTPSRQRFDRPDGQRVMRGKGGQDDIAVFKQAGGTGEIGHIGGHLAGEHREIIISSNLAQLDFRVPICAFDQPHKEAAVIAPGKFCGPIAQWHAAFLIGLDGQTEPLPLRSMGPKEKCVVRCQLFDDIHRQLKPFGFFGIDREMNVGIARFDRKIADDRHQFSPRLVCMQEIVLRVQRRELY